MNDYYEKVREYADWFYENEDGQQWDMDEIDYELHRCRRDGEWYLNTLSEETFGEFVHDVIEVYLNI